MFFKLFAFASVRAFLRGFTGFPAGGGLPFLAFLVVSFTAFTERATRHAYFNRMQKDFHCDTVAQRWPSNFDQSSSLTESNIFRHALVHYDYDVGTYLTTRGHNRHYS